jgi:hypothetical protein
MARLRTPTPLATTIRRPQHPWKPTTYKQLETTSRPRGPTRRLDRSPGRKTSRNRPTETHEHGTGQCQNQRAAEEERAGEGRWLPGRGGRESSSSCGGSDGRGGRSEPEAIADEGKGNGCGGLGFLCGWLSPAVLWPHTD